MKDRAEGKRGKVGGVFSPVHRGMVAFFVDSVNNMRYHLTKTQDDQKELMDTKQQSRWMTVYEVVGVLEVSDWTVRRMVDRGDLPAVKIGKKPLVKIDRGRFERWLENQ